MTIRARIAQALLRYENVAVWGAGGLAAQALDQWLPRDRIVCIIDGDPGKQGQQIAGTPVIGPDEANFAAFDCIVVCITAYLEVFETLKARRVTADAYYVFELFAVDTANMSEREKLRVDLIVQSSRGLISTLIDKPQAWVNISYRLSRHWQRTAMLRPIYLAMRILHSFACAMLSIDLPLTVVAGPGLVFPHLGGAVIHADTVLGSFVNIFQFSTVGSNDGGRVPVIGDFVILYSGSAVLGDCRIGNHSRVGANAVVLDTNCPPGSTLVGTPAKIVKTLDALPAR